MFFCLICNHTYDITKPTQSGGVKLKELLVEPVIEHVVEPVVEATEIAEPDSPVTVTTDDVQMGGAMWDELVLKIVNNEEISADTNIDLEEVKKSGEYKKLSKKMKELVHNKLYELMPVEQKIQKDNVDAKNNIAFFKCNNCGDMRPIKDGTLIFSRTFGVENEDLDPFHNIDLVNEPTLLRTRRYKCPNGKCVSHTDNNKREAVIYRQGDTYHVNYICVACNTHW